VGLIIWEMEIAEHFKWKDTADWSSIYRSYYSQWTSMLMRNGMLKHDCEQMFQISSSSSTLSNVKESL
jgi:hypothetical protein